MILKVRVKDLLNEMGLTQKELSEKTGLSPAIISMIVTNQKGSVNKKHIGIIAQALDVHDMNKIFEWE